MTSEQTNSWSITQLGMRRVTDDKRLLNWQPIHNSRERPGDGDEALGPCVKGR